MRRRGFTLLEVLVATAIMGIAVAAGISALRTSLRNADRQAELERAATLAQRKMEELLASPLLPHGRPFGDVFPPEYTSGVEAGWTALATPAEAATTPPMARTIGLERIRLEVWWQTQSGRKSMRLETYRRTILTAEDAEWMTAHTNELLGGPQ